MSRRRFPRDFYARPTLAVAADLVGALLVHERRGVRTSGRIVEVEAYIGESDPACHAAPGPTPRNRPLYGPPGYGYVYLNYGIHCLVNVVTEPTGMPAAVLIRALEPVEGIEIMRRRRARSTKGRRSPRGILEDAALCRGPGNVTMAMGISLGENGIDLLGSRLFIEPGGQPAPSLVWGPRVGIRVATDRPWRAYAAANPAVSRA
jgi:DNA-3-methyladenine glycosylase